MACRDGEALRSCAARPEERPFVFDKNLMPGDSQCSFRRGYVPGWSPMVTDCGRDGSCLVFDTEPAGLKQKKEGASPVKMIIL